MEDDVIEDLIREADECADWPPPVTEAREALVLGPLPLNRTYSSEEFAAKVRRLLDRIAEHRTRG